MTYDFAGEASFKQACPYWWCLTILLGRHHLSKHAPLEGRFVTNDPEAQQCANRQSPNELPVLAEMRTKLQEK